MPKPSGSGASASSSSPARWTGRGGTGPSTSSIPTGSWSSWPRRSPGSCLAMADVDDRASILAYHEATKHSPVSVRARGHSLDWGNRPFSLKVYTDLERIPLPEDIRSLGVPAWERTGATSVLDPTRARNLPPLGRLLVLGAGVHHTMTFRDGEVLYFRTYASAGACRAQKRRIGAVTRAFFEFARPAPPQRSRWGIQTVHRARHLFPEHCRATPDPMVHLRMVAGESQPGVASRGVGLSTFARSGEVSPLSRAS